MTVPIGVLIGMTSLILGPITIRSELVLSLVSLGKGIWKVKIPKRVAFSYGQQHLVGYLPWII